MKDFTNEEVFILHNIASNLIEIITTSSNNERMLAQLDKMEKIQDAYIERSEVEAEDMADFMLYVRKVLLDGRK